MDGILENVVTNFLLYYKSVIITLAKANRGTESLTKQIRDRSRWCCVECWVVILNS